jgi:hypothetical protein
VYKTTAAKFGLNRLPIAFVIASAVAGAIFALEYAHQPIA